MLQALQPFKRRKWLCRILRNRHWLNLSPFDPIFPRRAAAICLRNFEDDLEEGDVPRLLQCALAEKPTLSELRHEFHQLAEFFHRRFQRLAVELVLAAPETRYVEPLKNRLWDGVGLGGAGAMGLW